MTPEEIAREIVEGTLTRNESRREWVHIPVAIVSEVLRCVKPGKPGYGYWARDENLALEAIIGFLRREIEPRIATALAASEQRAKALDEAWRMRQEMLDDIEERLDLANVPTTNPGHDQRVSTWRRVELLIAQLQASETSPESPQERTS
jgi:hypothetical protein